MTDFITAVLIAIALVVLASVGGALFGGLSGWIVGFFWTDPILDFLRRFGVDVQGLTVWQIGVSLGFMGGFFKATLTTKGKD
jgi:hypothetical protein